MYMNQENKKAMDMVHLLSLLHSKKLLFYREVDIDKNKKYMKILLMILII